MTGVHVKIGVLSFLLCILLALPVLWLSLQERAGAGSAVEIAVEHSHPLTVSFTRLEQNGVRLLEVRPTGSGMGLSVPATWTRDEVRNAPLTAVTSESIHPQTIRWTIPENAIVRFRLPPARQITIANPSGSPLTVHTTIVDLEEGTREEDAVIITSEKYILP